MPRSRSESADRAEATTPSRRSKRSSASVDREDAPSNEAKQDAPVVSSHKTEVEVHTTIVEEKSGSKHTVEETKSSRRRSGRGTARSDDEVSDASGAAEDAESSRQSRKGRKSVAAAAPEPDLAAVDEQDESGDDEDAGAGQVQLQEGGPPTYDEAVVALAALKSFYHNASKRAVKRLIVRGMVVPASVSGKRRQRFDA